MRLFGVNEAKHFCKGFFVGPATYSGSLKDFYRLCMEPRRSTAITEGATVFEDYRVCLLREAERSVFLSISQYRRAVDLMVQSACPWCQVTLYYGAWFAAHAILGLLGGAIFPRRVIGVERGAIGKQTFRARKIGSGAANENTLYTGSHRVFWDLFYGAVRTLRPSVDPRLSAVLSPVTGDKVWLIDRRNEVNYDMQTALDLCSQFPNATPGAALPASLPGTLGTQWGITEGLVQLASWLCGELEIATDALDSIGYSGQLGRASSELVFDVDVPCLQEHLKTSEIVDYLCCR